MIPRHLTDRVLAALADTPVVLVNGARQVGKSTLAGAAALAGKGRRYLTFDDAGLVAAAKRDPNGFVEGLDSPVTLDEIQHVPELFPAIKMAVDAHRIPGKFLLTGSANVLLLPKLSESLAGRMEVLTLWPFSQGELAESRDNFVEQMFSSRPQALQDGPMIDRRQLLTRMLAGGYPPAIARSGPERRAAWFASYLATVLQRDIRALANIADLTAVPRLLSLLAARAGGLVNYAELSNSLGIPQTTLKRYFTLLESIFLVQPLAPWSGNLGNRAIRTPKIYLNDSGMLAHLIGLGLEKLELEPALAGPALENFVLMELRKQATWSRIPQQLFFWRTASGREVDIVVENSDGRLLGIEVKAASTLGAGDVRGLEALAQAAGKRWVRGIVLYTGTKVIPFGPHLHGIPVAHLWAADN